MAKLQTFSSQTFTTQTVTLKRVKQKFVNGKDHVHLMEALRKTQNTIYGLQKNALA